MDSKGNFYYVVHFIKYTIPTATNPVLLILDGHNSHTKNIEVIETARKNFVHIVCLPPHSSHKMQPLDVGFMKPFKTYYAQEIESFLRSRTQEDRDKNNANVTMYRVAKLFTAAYNRSATMENSINAFKKTGLYPLNRHIFRDYHFPVRHEDSLVSSTDPTLSVLNESMPGPSNIISPFDIKPVPILQPTSSNRAGSACVLTSSPYRDKIKKMVQISSMHEMKAKNKKGKENKPAAKRKLFSKKKKNQKNDENSTNNDNVLLDEMSSEDEENTLCLFCEGNFKDDIEKHGYNVQYVIGGHTKIVV